MNVCTSQNKFVFTGAWHDLTRTSCNVRKQGMQTLADPFCNREAIQHEECRSPEGSCNLHAEHAVEQKRWRLGIQRDVGNVRADGVCHACSQEHGAKKFTHGRDKYGLSDLHWHVKRRKRLPDR